MPKSCGLAGYRGKAHKMYGNLWFRLDRMNVSAREDKASDNGVVIRQYQTWVIKPLNKNMRFYLQNISRKLQDLWQISKRSAEYLHNSNALLWLSNIIEFLILRY